MHDSGAADRLEPPRGSDAFRRPHLEPMDRSPEPTAATASVIEAPTTPVLGIAVCRLALEQILGQALAAIEGRRPPVVVACANPHSLLQARRDDEFQSALANATHVLPDGIGVVWASRLSHARIACRITGWDFFHGLMSALEARGSGRVFFLGSTPATLKKIAERLAEEFPHLTLGGAISPPFGIWPARIDDAIAVAIERARPDVLWVGMTAPRQERWVERNRGRLAVPVVGSVGAVFDFYAGTVSRAPSWMRRGGVEWMHRLLAEPQRMWRRSFVSAPLFIGLMLRERLRLLLSSDPRDENRCRS